MDASDRGVKVVLHQKKDDGREWIVTYASKIFNKYKKKYPITK